jgi:protein ImuB
LPLQLLLRRHPQWVAEPVAVVADERPQSAVLWVNGVARQQGVVPGMRYAGALSLCPGLRAGPLLPEVLATEVEALVAILRRLSPGVERSTPEPGVFWLDASGLQGLYPSLQRWARLIVSELRAKGLEAHVVVGATRFGTYAIARAARAPVVVCADAADEQRLAADVELAALEVEPTLADVLFRLGVTTIDGLRRLPGSELARRFGPGAHRLQRLASGKEWEPLQPTAVEEPVRARLPLDEPELEVSRLLFVVKGLLHPLLGTLHRRGQRLVGAMLRLRLDAGSRGPLWVAEQVRLAEPVAPTSAGELQLMELLRLRLERWPLDGGVREVELTLEGVRTTAEQRSLLTTAPRRSRSAANRAIARLRAELGGDSVVRPRLRDGHLPGARFEWEPLERLPEVPRVPAAVRVCPPPPLVRRVWTTPRPFAWAAPVVPPGTAAAPAERLIGPYVLSGGWWKRSVHREYHFAQLRNGDLLWVYFDRQRERWFLQGTVE